MVRFHLLSLPLPLISHTKHLPKIVTVDSRQTQNIFKYNTLYFTISSRCFIQTPKAILPAERKKSCLLAFCGSGQQEEIFYSMAATIVRLEENSYRQSWKETEAALSCHCLCLQQRYDPFQYRFNIGFIHTSKRNKHAQFSYWGGGAFPVCVSFSFMDFVLNFLNTVLLRSEEGRECCPYVTDLALRRVS